MAAACVSARQPVGCRAELSAAQNEGNALQQEKLLVEQRWERWKSDPQDISKIPPHRAAQILFDMYLINEFEHALLRLKADDCVWGPVHTSVGQEAVAAASIRALTGQDKITGTHRAHHQFLSKAMNYVLDPSWDPAADAVPDAGREAITRTFAEIMGLKNGYCGGRGGSMHLRYLEAGVLGTNAIVAGGIPIAVGSAFAEKQAATGNVVVSYFGDGAINQGALHEAANLAGIWDLPVIFFIENNLYAVGTPSDEACAVKLLSQRANAYGMNALIVDGNDTVAIYEATRTAAEDIRAGGKPWFIEAFCYRKYHHAGDTPGSAFGYRSKEEEAQFADQDVMVQFPAALAAAGILGKKQAQQIREKAAACVQEAVDTCTNPGTPRTVREELWPSPESATEGVRSDGSELAGLRYAEREDFSDFRQLAYSDAIAEATGRWLERDERAVVLGEEVASFGGGAYGATKGLPKKYPDRVINTPISEAGFVGLGLGAAMSGMRPVVEVMFPDFAFVAGDQLFNQIAKARHMYGGTTNLPLVVRTRIAIGCGYGGQHSMDPVGLFALFAGWRIVAPSNSFDYVGLFNTAMHSNDPVVFLEHHALYKNKSDLPTDDLDYCIPFGKARLIAEGNDLTIVTYGYMTERLRALRGTLSEKGVSADIIDLRTLDFPSMDFETIGESLKKTGAMVIVEEAAGGQAIGNRIAAIASARYFDYLDAPCFSLTSLDVPNSVSRVLEAAAMLDDDTIVDTVVKAADRRLL